jgi:hypothetical protein
MIARNRGADQKTQYDTNDEAAEYSDKDEVAGWHRRRKNYDQNDANRD